MRKTLKRPVGVSKPVAPVETCSVAHDAAVLDVEHELAVEQHLEPAPSARSCAASAVSRLASAACVAGPADAVAAEPLPLLERHHGEPRLLAGLAVHRLRWEEREVGEPLLERAHGRRRIGRRARRGRAGRRHVRRALRPEALIGPEVT